MKKYFCDICGKQFDPRRGSTADSPKPYTGYFGVMCNGLDFCEKCAEIGQTVDMRRAAIEAWRQVVRSNELA